ncbi:MAG: hypothetical protein ACRENB_05390 [Gemmatimonadales bacterium]
MNDEHPGTLALLEVTDVSEQKRHEVEDVPAETTVAQLIDRLLEELDLERADGDGRPITYHAQVKRTGAELHAWEKVGDVLRSGDRLVMQPNIDAG